MRNKIIRHGVASRILKVNVHHPTNKCLVFMYCTSVAVILLFFAPFAAASANNSNGRTIFIGTKTSGLGSRKKTVLSSISQSSSSLLTKLIPHKKVHTGRSDPLSASQQEDQLWATFIYDRHNYTVTKSQQKEKRRPVALALFQKHQQHQLKQQANKPFNLSTSADINRSLENNVTDTACCEWGCVLLSSQMNNQLSVNEIKNWSTCSEEDLLPIDGIYGVFHLPSGPCLAVILESEATYNSPPAATAAETSYPPFLELRRIIRIDIIPIPFWKEEEEPAMSSHQQQEEARQIKLLRKALRSHELYFIPRREDYKDYRVCDVTHTLQRSLGAAVGAATARNNANTAILNDNVNDNIDVLQPDARFFWNQELVQSLLRSSNTAKQLTNNSMALSSIPVTSDNKAIESVTTNANTSLLQETNITTNTTASSTQGHVRNQQCIDEINSTKLSSQNDDSAQGLVQKWIIPCTSAFVGVSRNIPLVSPNGNRTEGTTTNYDELVISRRSRFRAGTRFTRRGVDTAGSVANYAETEQIIVLKDFEGLVEEVYSWVQTRGSIPLLWSSPANIRNYAPRVQIATNPLDQARSLRAHLLEQILIYTSLLSSYIDTTHVSRSHEQQTQYLVNKEAHNKISQKLIFVNLIDKKKDQGRLGRAFDSVLQAVLEIHGEDSVDHPRRMIPSGAAAKGRQGQYTGRTSVNTVISNVEKLCIPVGSVSHIWYDFHAECKGGNWNKLSKLLEMVAPDLDSHRYFSASPINMNNSRSTSLSWKISTFQTGIVRTNCMDCLDRTNVVQSIFGRHVLFRQLQHRDAAFRKTKRRNVPLEWVVAHKNNPLQLPFVEGEKAHRILWADNADAISRLYAGTPALKGDYTRTGRRTKRGALDDGMNSLTRYYINNFSDTDRQEGIDLMTYTIPFSNTDSASTNHKDFFIKLYNEETVSGAYSEMNMRSARYWLYLRRLLWGDLLSDFRTEFSLKNEDILSSIDRRASSIMPLWVTAGRGRSASPYNSIHQKRKFTNIGRLESSWPLLSTISLWIAEHYHPDVITSIGTILCIVFLMV